MNEQLQFNKGDLLCILCSLTFATHIIVTGILTRGVDSISLGVLQLGFVGIYSMVLSFIFETPRLPASNQSWFIVFTLSIFCTAIAFIVQTVAQKYTTSTHTGLIFSLEPAFGAIFAFIFAGEILSIRGYIGAIILIISILLVELDFKHKFTKSQNVSVS